MLEIIPGFNQKSRATLSSSSKNIGVDLAPIIISPSKNKCIIETAVFTFLSVAVTLSLGPFLFSAKYWFLVWAAFLLFSIYTIRAGWLALKQSPVELKVTQQEWQLKSERELLLVEPFGEILVWPSVIVLPLREKQSRRIHRIVVLKDTVNADDWRRLRVWLRMGLHRGHA